MNWKTIIIAVLALGLGIAAYTADGASEDARIWFGLGGSTVGLAFPDLAATNGLLIDRGFAPLGEGLIVTGGRGRGGVLGGLSLGGLGWGGEASSSSENRTAEMAVGFGGIEVGAAVGGDERSLLTLGAVLGGGGTALTLVEEPLLDGESPFVPCGIVPEPLVLSRYGAFLSIEPFVSFQVQPLHYFGFELHLGYVLPIASFAWGDAELAAGEPQLAGPVIGLSATWGAIGRPAIGPIFERPKVEETVDQSVSLAGPCVEVDNGIGSITIDTWDGDGVRIVAVKRAQSQTILDGVTLLIEPTRCGVAIHSKGPRNAYWEIEYRLEVPVGTEIRASQGAGDIRLGSGAGDASIELGVGEIEVEGTVGPSLVVRSGAGDIRLLGITADQIDVNLGTGEIEIDLPADAAHAIDATVGIGGLSVGPFQEMEAIEANGLGSSVSATLGEGTARLSIHLGVGEIRVKRAE